MDTTPPITITQSFDTVTPAGRPAEGTVIVTGTRISVQLDGEEKATGVLCHDIETGFTYIEWGPCEDGLYLHDAEHEVQIMETEEPES